MTAEEIRATTMDAAPPAGVSVALQAMWYAAKDDWHTAHELAQTVPDPVGAWVHAYLHRVEGDLGNAGYWYRRANRPAAREPLSAEWTTIVTALLAE